MKKLALALVCLVSVAFFASCDPKPVVENPEPSIAILTGEGYVYDGMNLMMGESYPIGFVCRANTETNKQLARLVININDEPWCDTVISGAEYTFDAEIAFVPEKGEIYDVNITAVLTDEDGQTATAEMDITVTEEDEPLEITPIEWIRRGSENQSVEDMASYGLLWTGSYKEVFATIKPMSDVKLYLADGNEFEKIVTDADKNAFMQELIETSKPIDEYRNITTNNSADYNDLLAVLMADGYINLIKISHAEIATGSFGTQITITGEAK